MGRRKWLWVALMALPAAVVGGMAFANSQKAQVYICPVTGETLPCEKCCPLNQKQAEKQEPKPSFICPETGEELPCPNCCPLKQ